MNVEDVVFPYIVLGAIDVKVSFFDNEEDEEDVDGVGAVKENSGELGAKDPSASSLGTASKDANVSSQSNSIFADSSCSLAYATTADEDEEEEEEEEEEEVGMGIDLEFDFPLFMTLASEARRLPRLSGRTAVTSFNADLCRVILSSRKADKPKRPPLPPPTLLLKTEGSDEKDADPPRIAVRSS
jgi:hypothetical protein